MSLWYHIFGLYEIRPSSVMELFLLALILYFWTLVSFFFLAGKILDRIQEYFVYISRRLAATAVNIKNHDLLHELLSYFTLIRFLRWPSHRHLLLAVFARESSISIGLLISSRCRHHSIIVFMEIGICAYPRANFDLCIIAIYIYMLNLNRILALLALGLRIRDFDFAELYARRIVRWADYVIQLIYLGFDGRDVFSCLSYGWCPSPFSCSLTDSVWWGFSRLVAHFFNFSDIIPKTLIDKSLGALNNLRLEIRLPWILSYPVRRLCCRFLRTSSVLWESADLFPMAGFFSHFDILKLGDGQIDHIQVHIAVIMTLKVGRHNQTFIFWDPRILLGLEAFVFWALRGHPDHGQMFIFEAMSSHHRGLWFAIHFS